MSTARFTASQLDFRPSSVAFIFCARNFLKDKRVGRSGLKEGTKKRPEKLRPSFFYLVGVDGIEPPTSTL